MVFKETCIEKQCYEDYIDFAKTMANKVKLWKLHFNVSIFKHFCELFARKAVKHFR